MVGGNWRYENDNGQSSAYRSLHINSARKLMSYRAFPMPDDYPDYPSHYQVAKYFDDYVEHFRLRDGITFRTEVVAAEPAEGGWDVTVEGEDGERRTERYRAVLVANGHHWNPRWPEPAFPGSEEFAGEQIHVHHYREADVLVDKRVLVLGIGNSAVDVAVESSRIAEKTFLAMRRGAYVIPKFLGRQAGRRSRPAGDDPAAALGAAVLHGAAAEGDGGGSHRLRPAQARSQAARGAPHRLLGAAPPPRPRRHRGEAQHRAFRRRQDRSLRRRQRRGDRPRRLLHRLQDHLPLPRAAGVRGGRQPDAPLQAGRLGRPSGPLLHRLHPASRPDHADRRGPVGMGRRPTPGPCCPAVGGGDEE